MLKVNRKAQATIFIIIAAVIVVGIVSFFLLRESLFGDGISAEFRPIYNTYQQCIEQSTRDAVSLLGTQGGRIETGVHVPGSDYAPFSSHLNFMGSFIPYWFYISGNNFVRESIPSRANMENEASEFVRQEISRCDFSSFYEQGFYIELGEPRVKVTIQDNKILTEVNSNLVVFKEDRSARKQTHKTEFQSKLGKFHKLSLEIYDKQKKETFLENYAVDVLRSYAPVDGVESQCTPKIWKTREVVDELYPALEANIGAIKMKGNYYDLNSAKDRYFVVDKSVDEAVSFLYLSDWPSKIEIFGEGVSQELMIAEPVGNQEGLGILGFCYIPYHFVYDISFPVLIQIHDGFDVFQFPVAVVVKGNLPRDANLESFALDVEKDSYDICQFRENDARIYTYDNYINPLKAKLSYKCFDSLCDLGETNLSGGDYFVDAKLPSCYNGQLIAKADGYAETKMTFSSNSESLAEIFLPKEYDLEVVLRVGGQQIQNAQAVVHFVSDKDSKSIVIPENNRISLREGIHNVSVFVYGNSNVVIPASRKVQCVQSASGGLFGFFGNTKEECFDIEIPSTRIENALIGGGKTNIYLLDSELERGKLTIDASALPYANSLEQLQYNFEIFNSLGVDLNFG